MHVMVENVVSVVSSECYNEILGKIKILLIPTFYFILVVNELEFCVPQLTLRCAEFIRRKWNMMTYTDVISIIVFLTQHHIVVSCKH